jgi:hypothetical protein
MAQQDSRLPAEIHSELHFSMEPTNPHSKLPWKWLTAAALVIAAGWFCYRWLYPAYDRPVQPVPNAYNTLIELSGKLAKRTGFWDEMSDQELASVVATNEPILADAREALRQESAVALDWNADQHWFGKVHIERAQKLRQLARAFAGEGRHAQKQGDTRRAVSCGLDGLKLVKVASSGGLGIDYFLGFGINAGASSWLRDACETATLDDCQYVLNNLPNIKEQVEPPSAITEREWHFFRRVNGVYMTFMTEMAFANNREDFEKRMEESLRRGQALNDLVRLHYAIRAFQLTEDRLPKSLEELVPRELKSIPKDPFNDQDFVYQPGKDRYLLFSVGPNGVDDGGVEEVKDQGDLLLEPRDSNGIGDPGAPGPAN